MDYRDLWFHGAVPLIRDGRKIVATGGLKFRSSLNQFLFRNFVYWVTINSANFPAALIHATQRRSADDKSKWGEISIALSPRARLFPRWQRSKRFYERAPSASYRVERLQCRFLNNTIHEDIRQERFLTLYAVIFK